MEVPSDIGTMHQQATDQQELVDAFSTSYQHSSLHQVIESRVLRRHQELKDDIIPGATAHCLLGAGTYQR